jgi:hypothetical protein
MFQVGDLVMWLTDFASEADVRAGDVGTVTTVVGTGFYLVRPDAPRRDISRDGWAALEQDLEACGKLAVECPCGISRSVCEYHR